jgi:hypothetical protein
MRAPTVLRDLSVGRLLRRTVRIRVAFVFPAEAQTPQDAQAVGIEGEHGKSAREQEDLFGAGVADRGELLQGLDGILGGTPESAREVAAELLERGRGDLAELLDGVAGQNPRPADLMERRARRREDSLGLQPRQLFQQPERLRPPGVAGEVSDVLEQNLREGIGHGGRLGPSVVAPESLKDAAETGVCPLPAQGCTSPAEVWHGETSGIEDSCRLRAGAK